ncbi:MAG: molecular chaperone TorD family protein [Armatimonadota bacterium]|nr:molecular chaperone TorD family protein [Armatimonadota bacterium]MDR7403389.1 molecular chaperone TorD family protein [Armatimonadota bacterium]
MGVPAVARARARVYQALAQALQPPDDSRLASLAGAPTLLRRRVAALAGLAQGDPASRLVRLLEVLADTDLLTLQTVYVRVFGLDGSGGRPACESYYRSRSPEDIPRVLAAVERAYAAMGVAVDPAGGLPPDHLTVELECAALLCAHEAAAWRSPSGAAEVLAREQRFLRDHLGGWLPALGTDIARRDPVGVYAGIVSCAGDLVRHDLAWLQALVRAGAGGSRGEEGGES